MPLCNKTAFRQDLLESIRNISIQQDYARNQIVQKVREYASNNKHHFQLLNTFQVEHDVYDKKYL